MAYLRSKHGPLPSVMAARIRAERERLGLSQEATAEKLGIRRNTYKNLECTANPQLSTLIALTNVVGMDARILAPELFK